jgi:hypothetical protein
MTQHHLVIGLAELLRRTLQFHVRFGSEADMCDAKSDVRFAPDSDRESGLQQKVISVCPRKQTCALQLGMSALGQ